VRLGERTPLIFIDIPPAGEANGSATDTVMLYGHLDKQPEMTGWREGLGPWTPVLEGDKLYGRGGADDGYALFASLTAINAVRKDRLPHARCVILIEACEESGSYDLPAYVEHLATRIGELSLVICLDSGCANYDQLWSTTSLRGLVMGNLEVSLLNEGVHSGDGTGVIAASERVARSLLDRLEDSQTGAIKLPELKAEIPKPRLLQAERAAAVLGDRVFNTFPLKTGVSPLTRNNVELILNRTWRPGSRSPAPTAGPRSAMPATCCARSRSSSFPSVSAARRRPGRRRRRQAHARSRSAIRRQSHVQQCWGERGLGRAGAGAMARAVPR